jgi:hypothetical protein
MFSPYVRLNHSMHNSNQVIEKVQVDELSEFGKTFQNTWNQFVVWRFFQNIEINKKYLLQNLPLLKLKKKRTK